MAQLRQLKMTRANIKRQMTRINNVLDAETTAGEAQLRAQKIEEYYAKFDEVQKQIDNLRISVEIREDEEEELMNQIQEDSEAERTVFEESYYAAAIKARRYIDAEQQRIQQQMQQQNHQQNGGNNQHRVGRVKIPILELPHFSGDYEEWLLFKDAFTSMIHLNDDLESIEKFQYLRRVLGGEALQVIAGLDTTAAEYENAWELLVKTYDNTKLLINTHLNKLLDFPAIVKDKPATIRQLVVHLRTHSNALKTMKLPVDHWDDILIHLVKDKMDFNTKKDWEENTNRDQTKRPTLEDFLIFLSDRGRTLEMIDKGQNKQESSKPSAGKKQEKRVALASVAQKECAICREGNAVYHCPKFLQLSISDRINEAKAKRICINCFGKGHFAAACKSSACKRCQKKHNTLLHLEQENSDKRSNESSSTNPVVTHCTRENNSWPSKNASSSTNVVRKPISQVILSTARVKVEDVDGNPQSCRVLLDPGSQSNLISEELVRRLKLKCSKRSELISGINKAQTNIARTAEVKLRSMYADYETTIDCLVLPSITERLPQVKINTRLIYIPDGLQLADPNFHEPGTIDLLVGAGLFWQLICADSIKQERGIPRLQNTLLGWIVGGELIDATPKQTKFCGLVTNSALQKQLERFWNQEETHETRRLTKDEADCERQFVESVKRDQTGRFTVALPKIPDVILGDSGNHALKRLYAIERRIKANPEIKSEYIKFMQDYEDQGHMSSVSNDSRRPKETYVIPHQPVIRLDSMTTKLRVVFDASAKTSNGTALNDKLMVGPNLQNELFHIILRFRAHEYVVTADIAAMFRQIIIQEQDRDLQRILWRSDQAKPIQTYCLNTVTYGTAPAPYLAIRCLRQLATDETEFPQASRILQEDFYMDDVLTGGSTVEEMITLQKQLSELLQKGQFQLRKWRSNDQRVLENLTNEGEVDSLLKIDKEGPIKTLGLLWDSSSDSMQYSVTTEESYKIAKRLVLSKIAQIFDPLGLLGPVIIQAKCVMQRMWQLKTGWNELLPPQLQATWNEYYTSLPKINEARIRRNINPGNCTREFDLIGFGDASEKAYGACLYAVSQNEEGIKQSHLIGSKSRVAPLKTVSLPRLELNAALLLAKLCDTARKAYGEKIRSIYLWSDSTIALSWISAPPNTQKTYVANRISQIQDLSQDVVWQHVPSKDNPADLISRGITVEDWKHNLLWWHGPNWLTTGEWPQQKKIELDTSETKPSFVLVSTNTMCDVLRRFSSFEKLQRVIAYCLRFKTNALGGKIAGPLSVEELAIAEKFIIKMTQNESFQAELQALKQERELPKGSSLAALTPFLDQDGIIRVGGRLSRADIPETEKHPIILPSRNHITKIIVEKEHRRLHHCGPEQLLHSLRQRYWPHSGRREARKVTGSCLECFRRKPRVTEVMMGDLASTRVRGSLRPFTNAGVDYAGPLQVRESRRRGRIHVSKAWIAVFTCFATKAVHLELVTELTTESFLAALRRFVARRGICTQISSDNGTNFVGAARELKEVYDFLRAEHDTISDHLARQKIEWEFIPPRAPHFGGLWEAAVKAAKRHLNTVTKGLVSTFEEYYTLLVEIESILNSRPLTPLSSDPNDLSALTPAHFLVGDTLLSPAEHSYVNVSDNKLSRWQHLQKVRQHFWSRWHREYLQELQTRKKWRKNSQNLELNTLVLLKEDHVAPLHWVIGRVVEVHPGADNVTRVVTVKTPTGLFKRAVKNLCPLPIADED